VNAGGDPAPVAIALAVLDMAGTTVADDGLVTDAFLAALEAVGIGSGDPSVPGHLAYVHSTMGASKIDVFRHLLGDEARAVHATAAFESAVSQAIDRGRVEPLPGAEHTLARLGRAGIGVCLTTGFSADTQAQLIRSLGWEPLVDLMLAPGPGRRGRPHPDLVLAAVLALGIDDVRATAVVGDTANDLLSGWRAGAGVVAGVLTGAHGRAELAAAPHTHILASVADLPAALGLDLAD